MPRRETRRFKAGSFAISFGALMLPLVCLIAIGLLLVTGKMFFLSGFQANRQPIPSAAALPAIPLAKPEVPRGGTERMSSQPPNQRAAAVTNTGNRNAASRSGEAAEKEKVIVVIPTPPSPRKPEPRPQTQTSPKPIEPRRTAPKSQQPAQTRTRQVRPSTWMVQVGAYSTKASADSVVKALAQSGHTASVSSGNKLHRVLVQAGATKQDALNLAARLDKAGFPGAFAVLPAS